MGAAAPSGPFSPNRSSVTFRGVGREGDVGDVGLRPARGLRRRDGLLDLLVSLVDLVARQRLGQRRCLLAGLRAVRLVDDDAEPFASLPAQLLQPVRRELVYGRDDDTGAGRERGLSAGSRCRPIARTTPGVCAKVWTVFCSCRSSTIRSVTITTVSKIGRSWPSCSEIRPVRAPADGVRLSGAWRSAGSGRARPGPCARACAAIFRTASSC